MNKLTSHKVDFFNRDHLDVAVQEPDRAGEASCKYDVMLKNLGNEFQKFCQIKFQRGPLFGATTPGAEPTRQAPNGLTIECLLAIVIDQLKQHNNGTCACRENSIALTHVETALLWLGARARDHESRGVEGTTNP